MSKAPLKDKTAELSEKSAKAAPKGKKIEKPKPGAKPNALQQPLQPSKELAAVVGSGTFARGEVVSKVWEYIKGNKLQSPKDGRQIVADKKLEAVFGKKEVTMFEMNKLLSAHLHKPE
jgi:upstream activation factor subunit UAF30